MNKKYPNTTLRPQGWLGLLFSFALIPVLLQAQENDTASEEVFELSPFQIDASGDQGYYSAQTLAGGRLSTNLKDVATSVQVVTAEFIEDIGATSLDEILAYTTGTEAVGIMNDYFQLEGEDGDLDQSEARQNPDAALRVRGLAAPTRTTNYFESAVPFHSYVWIPSILIVARTRFFSDWGHLAGSLMCPLIQPS